MKKIAILGCFALMLNIYAAKEVVTINYKELTPKKCNKCKNNYVISTDLFSGVTNIVKNEKKTVKVSSKKTKTIFDHDRSLKDNEQQNNKGKKGRVNIHRLCECYIKLETEFVDKTKQVTLSFPDYSKFRDKFKKYNDEQFKILVNYNKAKSLIYFYKIMIYKQLLADVRQSDAESGALPILLFGQKDRSAERKHFIEKRDQQYLKHLKYSVKKCTAETIFDYDFEEFIKIFSKTSPENYDSACRTRGLYYNNNGYKVFRGEQKDFDKYSHMTNPLKAAGLDGDMRVVKDYIRKTSFYEIMVNKANKENSKLGQRIKDLELKEARSAFDVFLKYIENKKIIIKELTGNRVVLNQGGVEFAVDYEGNGKIKNIQISKNRSLFMVKGKKDNTISWLVKTKYLSTMKKLKSYYRKSLYNNSCPTIKGKDSAKKKVAEKSKEKAKVPAKNS